MGFHYIPIFVFGKYFNISFVLRILSSSINGDTSGQWTTLIPTEMSQQLFDRLHKQSRSPEDES